MKADKQKVKRLLKTSAGQIEGIIKMIDADKYCIDVFNQIMASSSVLKRAAKEVLRAHINSCVVDSFGAGNKADKNKKINEIISVFDKTI